MNTTGSESALDEILRQNPAIDPKLLHQAKQAVEFLRNLGLLSTEPVEAIRPFSRRHNPSAESAHGISFTKIH